LPLSEKTRIEVYLPDIARQAYSDLLKVFDQEFTYTFGGCTIIRGLEGNYLAGSGVPVPDHINLLYTDMPHTLKKNFSTISRYADTLREIAFAALEEEAILIAVYKVFHSTGLALI
jgi:hypothetical protein